MATHWWLQLSVVLLVSNLVTGDEPEFRCGDISPGCLTGNYLDMNGFTIAETDEVGKWLYTIEAFDPDDPNTPVTYEMLPYGGALNPGEVEGIDYLNVNLSTGDVTTKADVDYETFQKLRLRWKVTDKDGEVLNQPIIVLVTNINDNNPEFTSPSYRLDAIEEGTKTSDDVITTVNATDKDSADNIVYDIIDSHLNWPCNGDIFEINPTTGEISLKDNETLDFEVSTLYTICVRASDSGEPVGDARYGYAQVIVAIQDVQDQPPYFDLSNYDKEVPEDAPVGSQVLEVNARDGDRGVLETNQILYSLTGGDGKFEIDNSTGQIIVREPLDRENQTSHIMTVVAQEIRANGSLEPPPSSAEVSITIQVGDVDDRNATFTAKVVDILLTENTLEGSFVSLDGLAVEDIDQAPNNRFYLHLDGRDADTFEVSNEEPIIGEAAIDLRVRNNSKLDFEENRFLEFEILATDVDGNFFDVAYVHVNITDQNDETPTFDQTQYTFTVEENSQGVVVGQVNATDRDSEPYNQVEYQLFGQGDSPQFEMDPTTGVIKTRDDASLDYERQSVYFFTVVATDGLRTGTAIVQVDLLDQNDNAPVFSSTSYTTTPVEENTIPQQSILTVSASDADRSTNNSEITYSFWNTPYSDIFSINAEGEIRLQQQLDFEEDGSEIELIVVATDGGDPQLSANATVKVRIQDMNDQSPVFTKDVYDGSVSETAGRGGKVVTVSANDADQEDTVNSRIDYFLVDSIITVFRIGISTGEVVVNSDLDRDERSNYFLEVIAIDRGEPSRNGTCHINITILDVNNKPPFFNESNPTADVYEDVASGSFVTMVTALDKDETSILSYDMDWEMSKAYDELGEEVPLSSDQLFLVDGTTGGVYTNGSLEREDVARFEITIAVEDLKAVESLPQIAETILTINVLDVNDNAPEFSQDGYQFTVVENIAVGSIISTEISATDGDEGVNGEIRFKLTDDMDSLMRIDPNSGILYVNGTFDRERYPNYTAVVVAYDLGSPELSSNETVVISISDVNDNSPVFDRNLSDSVDIPEDYPNGTVVLRVSAYDEDKSEEFGTVRYEIAAGDPVELFTIDETEGTIMIRDGKELDRETEDTHILTITAIDGDGKQDSIQVTIEVSDVNDERPVFTSSSNSISLQESVEVGQPVTTLTATDADQPNTNNSRVEYFIESGNDEDLFEINTVNLGGVITTRKSLSNKVGKYNLLVVAMDTGTPPLQSDPFNFEVIVTDVNDDTPEIISPQDLEIFYVPENYTGFVLDVIASDTDAGLNGEVTFRFIPSAENDDQDYFKIDNNGNDTATISILTKTDREEKDTYILEVEVKDLGESPLAASVSFTVKVNDTDDNEPLFGTGDRQAEFTVFENDDTAVIGSVDLATDADEPQNQHIYYFIVDGNGKDQADGAFVLDKTTGVLSLQKPLDREQNETMKLVVMVTSDMDFVPSVPIPYDAADDTLLEVTVTVKDRNDNKPVFYVENKLYTGGVEYSTPFDTEVIKVTAIDNDVGDNAFPLYSITSQKYTSTDGNERDETAFGISDNTTGVIVTKKVFEKGDAGYYTLIVKAEDSLNPAFSDTATVSMYLFSEDQQVQMTIFKPPDEVRAYQDDFKKTIEEIILKYGVLSTSQTLKRAADTITPAIVIDDIQVLDIDGQPNPGWSVMRFHAVNIEDNTIIAPQVIVDAIDDAYDYTEVLRGEYGVDEIVIAIPPTEPPPDLTWIQWLLVGILCAVVVIAIGLVATICIMTSSYRRKLRAATAGVYEPINPSANANHAPNTNKYTEPGSNPLYDIKLENEYEKKITRSGKTSGVATEDNKEKISNGHAKQIPADSASASEEQEVVVDMFDDSQDYDEIGNNETGDRLLLQVLADYEKDKQEGMVNIPEFANMTITEI